MSLKRFTLLLATIAAVAAIVTPAGLSSAVARTSAGHDTELSAVRECYALCFTEGGNHLHWSAGPYSSYQQAEAARSRHAEATGHTNNLVDCSDW